MPVGQEKSATLNDQPASPRLLALRDRLTSGDRTALDKFWKEISEQGAPLIEPAADSDHDILVTMLWRATGETKNVFVFRLGDVNKPMARLLDTDLWYKTFRLQKGARFVYQFATNLPDPKEWRGISQFEAALRNDPLNPFQFSEHYDELNPSAGNSFSAVELPSAEPQSWNVVHANVPAGRVQRDKFRSKLLGNERPIWIYTPHDFTVNKSYGLLVLTDGGQYVNTVRVATILDNLIAAGLIPSLVAVMVENPDRWRELSCNSTYADFLAQEIVPWARANYHATDRPEQTIIGGTSLGGLQAAFVGLKHSEVFGNVLSQSGAFGWMPNGEKEPEWLTRQFAASPRLPLRFSFEAGLLEGTWWWRDLMAKLPDAPPANLIDPTRLAANRNLRDTLQRKGYSVHYTEFNGNHTLFNWRGTLASHLIALVGIKPAQETAEQEVLNTEREQRDAYLKRDIAKTERLIADEYIFTNGREIGNKKNLIGYMTSTEPDPTLTLTSEDTRVTISGDTAIVTGRRVERRRREDNNREGVAYARYMRTYIKRQEQWQLLAEHLETIPAERTAVKIDTKVYDDYVGQYESAIFDFAVVKDGERLMAVPKERTTTRTSQGRPPAELFPESDAEFFLKGRDAQVIFIRNRKGEVTHAIMRINSADIRAIRVK
jgi:enterochelin esterase family protein